MNIIVTGAHGQLGSELVRQSQDQPYQVIALARSDLDITQPDRLKQAFEHYRPGIVINAAAYTQVDQAEVDIAQAYHVNTNGAINCATACAQMDIPLLHVSTDYVFNGKKNGAYVEQDRVNPLNVYGTSKWLGEMAVRKILRKHIILRASWIYGAMGANFVKTIIKLARQQETIKVVNDQWGCPTSARGLAECIIAILTRMTAGEARWGVYHYCEGPAVTWYGFAQAIIAAAADYEPLRVQETLPIRTDEYPRLAKRPSNSVLSCQRLTTTFGIQPYSWQEQLPRMIGELYS